MKNTYYNERGGSRPWRRLRAQVLKEEPTCRVRIAGVCTVVSTTVNHIVPKAIAPHLVMSRPNCQGSCRPCNLYLGKRSRAQAERKRPRSGGSKTPARALEFFA